MPDKPVKEAVSAWMALEVVWDICLRIIVPLIVFTSGGNWLDKKFTTSPLFLILGVSLAFVVIGLSLSKLTKRLSRQIEKQ